MNNTSPKLPLAKSKHRIELEAKLTELLTQIVRDNTTPHETRTKLAPIANRLEKSRKS